LFLARVAKICIPLFSVIGRQCVGLVVIEDGVKLQIRFVRVEIKPRVKGVSATRPSGKDRESSVVGRGAVVGE
jgi:hypothetical protein